MKIVGIDGFDKPIKLLTKATLEIIRDILINQNKKGKIMNDYGLNRQIKKLMGFDQAEPPLDENVPWLVEAHNEWQQKEELGNSITESITSAINEIAKQGIKDEFEEFSKQIEALNIKMGDIETAIRVKLGG